MVLERVVANSSHDFPDLSLREIKSDILPKKQCLFGRVVANYRQFFKNTVSDEVKANKMDVILGYVRFF